ncbi:MAG: acyltransferase [Opitutales bacterium]|nr:acyltransferase [Opitutales bacterium]
MEAANETKTPPQAAIPPISGQELDNAVASWLRFPLIALVVMMHISFFYHFSGEYSPWFKSLDIWSSRIDAYPIALTVIRLLQNVVTCVAIPLFLFISGYFYFSNIGRLTPSVWLAKTNRRLASLVLPYFVWNILAFAQIYVFWHVLGHEDTFMDWAVSFNGGNASDYVGRGSVLGSFAFIVAGGTISPGDVLPRPLFEQFWFIRDLFVFCLFSPVFWFLLKRKWVGTLVVAVSLLAISFLDRGGSLFTLKNLFFESVFFGIGAFLAIHKISFSDISLPVRWWVLGIYAGLVFIDFNWDVWQFPPSWGLAHNAVHVSGIVFGSLTILAWIAQGLKVGELLPHKFLAGATFFVFCSQTVGSRIFEVTIWRLLPEQSEFEIFVGFIFFTAFVLAFSVTLFWILRRFAPIGLLPLSGGRK